MTTAEAVTILHERAESYARDARVLREEIDDHAPMAAAYQAIADELRLVAKELDR